MDPREPRDERDPDSRVDLSGLRRLSPQAPPPKPERPSRREGALPRMIAFFVAALVFAAAPWYVFTKVLKDEGPVSPRPAASRTPSASPTPSATPSPASTPGTYEVVNTTKCVRVRAAPGTDQVVLTCLGPGVRVSSDGRIEDADGFIWLHVKYRTFDGWTATQYLKKVD